jgi:hypothetical protein
MANDIAFPFVLPALTVGVGRAVTTVTLTAVVCLQLATPAHAQLSGPQVAAPVTSAPAASPAPPTAQRIEPIIAPVNRAKPTTPKLDPAVAASIKSKAGQLATAVKAVPKQDAVAAAKAALASAKVAMAKALAAKKTATVKPAGKPTAAKPLVKSPSVATAAKAPAAAATRPVDPPIVPVAKPL